MDKVIYLLDKSYYSETMVSNLTEKDLEEWVAEEDYEDNYTIVKIDANGYDSIDAAIRAEMGDFWMDYTKAKDMCYIISFGFNESGA